MSFDEAYANMVHDEFRAAPGNGVSGVAAHAAASETTQATRTRTIALVASGGIACAVVGALLGGLGGEFGISPASAHALNSSSETVPLSSVADAAFLSNAAAAAPSLASGVSIGSLTNTVTGGTSHGAGSVTSTLASAVGGLLGGTSPFIPPAVDPTAPITGDPVTSTSGGSTTPSVGAAVNDVTLGLNDVLGNLTKALAAIVSMPSDPAAGISDVVTDLNSTLGDITMTLTNLTTDLPLPSGVLGGLPIVSALAPTSAGTLKTTASSGASVPSGLKALAPVVAAVNGLIPSTGSGTPSLPSLPTVPLLNSGSSAPLPSLPTTSTLSLPDLPGLNLPTLPGSSSGTSGGVTIPVPLPSGVNLSVHPVIGPISVGVTVGSSGITVSAG